MEHPEGSHADSYFVILAGVLWVPGTSLALPTPMLLLFSQPINNFSSSWARAATRPAAKKQQQIKVPHCLPILPDRCLLAQTRIQAAQTPHPWGAELLSMPAGAGCRQHRR